MIFPKEKDRDFESLILNETSYKTRAFNIIEYSKHVIKGRWIEGEKFIFSLEDSPVYCSTIYVLDAVKERCLAYEDFIISNAFDLRGWERSLWFYACMLGGTRKNIRTYTPTKINRLPEPLHNLMLGQFLNKDRRFKEHCVDLYFSKLKS